MTRGRGPVGRAPARAPAAGAGGPAAGAGSPAAGGATRCPTAAGARRGGAPATPVHARPSPPSPPPLPLPPTHPANPPSQPTNQATTRFRPTAQVPKRHAPRARAPPPPLGRAVALRLGVRRGGRQAGCVCSSLVVLTSRACYPTTSTADGASLQKQRNFARPRARRCRV
jgi:hypothetical protein